MENQYRKQLLKEMSEAIESLGKEDDNYSPKEKAIDILNVLEGLLGFAICTTCNTTDQIRDASELSFVRIKKRALLMHENRDKLKKQ